MVDMDTKTVYEKERIKSDMKKDKQLHHLQWESEEYHHFLKVTKKRRKAWVDDEQSTKS
jgi:hypothetical protein